MGGSNTNPDTFMFLQRVKFYITQKILEDDDFDIFSMQEKLEEPRDLSDMEYDRNSDAILPSDLKIQVDEVETELIIDENEDVEEEVLDDKAAERFPLFVA